MRYPIGGLTSNTSPVRERAVDRPPTYSALMNEPRSFTSQQLLFKELFVGTLIYAVVLGFFDDHTSIVETQSYTYVFLAAIVLEVLTCAAFAVKDPDSAISQALSMFPLTSPAALACRLVLTEVPGWQIVTAFLLILGCIWLLRRAAGKIFHLGVLMYGKEPGLREMIRWLRET